MTPRHIKPRKDRAKDQELILLCDLGGFVVMSGGMRVWSPAGSPSYWDTTAAQIIELSED